MQGTRKKKPIHNTPILYIYHIETMVSGGFNRKPRSGRYNPEEAQMRIKGWQR
jgi:hypothetical protein